MSTHVLKCWTSSFTDIVSGRKPFEVRVNDRDYNVGDVLELWEYDPHKSRFSGRLTAVTVTAITDGTWGLPRGLCVLGFNPDEARNFTRVDEGVRAGKARPER